MSLRDYRRVLGEKWPVWTAALVLGLLVATVVAVLTPSRYASETSLYFTPVAPPENLAVAYDGLQLAGEKAANYVPLIAQDRLAGAVADRLGPGSDVRSVSGSILASHEPGTPLLTVTATSTSPARAQTIARAAGEAVVDLVAQVEQPVVAGDAPDVVARIVQPATFSDSPVSVADPVVILLGGVLGLVAGVLLVLVRNAVDGSLRARGDIERITGARVLGTVERTRATRRRPLIADPNAPPELAESFRYLRASLAHQDGALDDVVVVTSARTGDGRTTLVLNLATMLVRAGRSVLVVDADLRGPGVHAALGAEADPGLGEVLAGVVTLASATRRARGGFDVLVAGGPVPDPAEAVGGRAMARLLHVAREGWDTVLVDTPPLGSVADAALATHGEHRVLLAIRYGHTSTDDVEQITHVLDTVGVGIAGVVVTMAPRTTGGTSRSRGKRGSTFVPGPPGPRPVAPPVPSRPTTAEPGPADVGGRVLTERAAHPSPRRRPGTDGAG